MIIIVLMRCADDHNRNLKAWVVGLCILLLCAELKAQQNLRFQTVDNYEYVVKVDPVTNALTTGDEPYFLPWLPQNQFGWQIQDQNYLDLFFKNKVNNSRKLRVDFYENLVLAIVKYDTHPWQLNVERVVYYPKRHHIHLIYSGTPLYQRAYAKQTSAVLVIIEQNRRIQKEGDRNLSYSVEKIGDDPELLMGDGEDPTKIFPLAFTNTHIQQQNNRVVELSKYMQAPESLVEGNREGLSEEELRKIERDSQEAKKLQVKRERERRNQQLAQNQDYMSSREREKKSQKYANNPTNIPNNSDTRRDAYSNSGKSNRLGRATIDEDNSSYMSLSFQEARGYMARRDVPLNAVNYLVLQNKLDWDAYLKKVPVGMSDITPVDERIFRTHIGIAVIKKGNTYWEMDTYGAWQNGEELRINYEAILTRDNLGWEAATLFVVFVERRNFSWVSFIQNGQKMQQVKVE